MGKKLERYACLIIAKPEKLENKSTDDGVIGFHVRRGLLLCVLYFWVFSGPSNKDAESVRASFVPMIKDTD